MKLLIQIFFKIFTFKNIVYCFICISCELTRILFDVNLLDADCSFADLNTSVNADGMEPLCDLVCTGKVGIIIALLIEGCILIDFAVKHKTSLYCKFDCVLVCYGKHTGHTAASGADAVIGLLGT